MVLQSRQIVNKLFHRQKDFMILTLKRLIGFDRPFWKLLQFNLKYFNCFIKSRFCYDAHLISSSQDKILNVQNAGSSLLMKQI